MTPTNGRSTVSFDAYGALGGNITSDTSAGAASGAGAQRGFDLLVAQAVELLATIRVLHQSLAVDPDPGGDRERELLGLLTQRDALGAQLGLAVLRVLATGGTISVAQDHAELLTPTPGRPEPVVVDAGVPEPVVVVELLASEPVVPAAPRDLPPAPPRSERSVAAPVVTSPPTTPVRLDPPAALRKTLELLGRPVRADTPQLAAASVDRLLAATAEMDGWLVHTMETQRALVGLVSALARHVQDEAEVLLDPDHERALRGWFSAVGAWSKLYRPGFVPGLSRKNGPSHESWLTDAEHWWWVLTDAPAERDYEAPRTWSSGPGAVRAPAVETVEISERDALRAVELAIGDPTADLGTALQTAVDAGFAPGDARLVRLLVGHPERLLSVKGWKTLKTAVKAAARTPVAGDEATDDEDRTLVPTDWPFGVFTRGRKAVIVGGDRRPEAAERMQLAFGFASCEWAETDPRRVAALVERVRARTIDIVIALRRYIAHKDMDRLVDACREADVPYAAVDTGYGVGQVRLAIERYLRPRLEGDGADAA